MGIQKGISIVDTLAKSKTFMKVARNATKGQCVMKNAEVKGKQAAKFFEGMPIMSNLMCEIPNENLVIRYGTKGAKGSSVTGFHVFSGDTLIAKGAMGIDKTRGKEPILQMRWQLGENGNAARMNLTYNGNRPFNGNVTGNQVSLDGKFSLSQKYGDTFSLEYAETPARYDFLTNAQGKSLRNCGNLPTAHQFEQYQQETNRQLKNFVNGTKRKLTPEEKLKLKHEKHYEQEYKLRRREEMQHKLADVQAQYEPKISELRTKIAGQNLSKVELNAAKQELKLLQKQLKEDTRAIQGRTSRKRPDFEKDRQETVDLSNVRFFSNKKSVQSIMRNESLSLRSIPAYQNKEVLAQLKGVKGTTTEKIEQIKEIFCKEMGIDSSMVEIAPVNGLELLENKFQVQFKPVLGKIVYNEELLSKMSTSQIAGIIRHELDHMEVFGKLAKSLGPKDFKELVLNIPGSVANRELISQSFNAEFYTKLAKQVNTQGFDTRLYEQAVRNYKGIEGGTSIAQTLKSQAAYYANPLEQSAYGIEISLAKSLGSSGISRVAEIHTIKQIAIEIERIERIAPNGFDMNAYLTRIIKGIKTRMGDKIEANEFNYNLLQELRKV